MKKTTLPLLLALVAGITATTCTSSLRAQTSNWDFNYSGSIVQWTAPQTGSYQITAYGAQGGGDWGFGGSGAIMSGTFHLNEGNVLNILVGGQGARGGQDYVNNYYSPSGGGGSFVAGGLGGPSSLLVVAGGGGGVDPYTEKSTDTGAADASTGTSGKHATGTYRSSQEGAGGTDGSGGTIGIDSANDGGGGGGGGFSGNGGSHVGGGKAQGGFAYLNGGAGGAGGSTFGYAPPNGGFGGGGGGGAESGIGIATAPGGGGGYSGGGGAGAKNHAKGQSKSAGGGGSYLAPSATDISKSVGNTGYGLVTIDLVTSLSFYQPSFTFDYSPMSQFRLKAFSSSPGAITFASGDSSLITILGDVATIKGAGQTIITATVAAAPGFYSHSDYVPVTVNKSRLWLRFVSPSSIVYAKRKPLTLKTNLYPYLPADGGAGGVAYTSSDPSVISINGNKATALKKGIVTITASVPATVNHLSATATQVVTVK